MKKIQLCLLFSLIAIFGIQFNAIGQTTPPQIKNEKELKLFLGETYYNRLLNDNSNTLKAIDFRVSNGYVLLNQLPEKYKNLPIQSQFKKLLNKTDTITISSTQLINEINNKTFNILRYPLFKQSKTKDNLIRLDNTHVLIIRSVNTLIMLQKQ